jgi:hypothetical protein
MRRAATLGAVAAVVGWLAAAVVLVLLARSELHAGIDSAEQIRDTSTPHAIARGRLLHPAREAEAHFARARRRLGSPVLWPVDVLPIAGRHLSAVRRVSASARDVMGVATRTLEEARRAVNAPHATGPDRLAMLQQVASTLRRTNAALRTVPGCGHGPFVSPIAGACNRFARELADVRAAVATASAGADAGVSLLGGPRRYLVIAGNNAEMRAGAGMPLQIGVLETANGTVHLGDMTPIDQHTVPSGVQLPPDLARDWGWMRPTTEWRNLLATPAFDRWAPIAAEMWRAAGNEPVDGVLLLDPVALARILDATGPVEADGQAIDGARAVPFLLHDQYVRFDDLTDRRDHLAAIANAAFAAVSDGRWELPDLLDSLSRSVSARHLLVWSSRAAEQNGWERVGADGALREDEISVSLVNRGGNKLDWFTDVRAQAAIGTSNGGGTLRLDVTVHNRVGTGEPNYIAGPHPDLDTRYGLYRGLLEVVLPPGATAVTPAAGAELAVAGRELGFVVVAQTFDLAAGETRTFTFDARLPRGLTPKPAPSARVPAVQWTIVPPGRTR